MSGEPKTLWEMTPREAWEHAWEQAIDTCRVFEEEATAGRLEVVRSIGRQYLDQDAGVPVVARDEAAEPRPIGWDDVTDEDVMAALVKAQTEASVLRKAIREWADAVAKLNALIHGIPGHRDDVNAADDRLTAAEAALRRLAGGESEK